MSDLGSLIKNVIAVAPQDASDVVSGGSVTKSPYESTVVSVMTGATSGSPTSFEVAAKLEHADTSGVWDAVSGGTASIEAANTVAEINVNLNEVKRYMRVVLTPTFNGGSSPSVYVASAFALGQSKYGPAV